MTLSILIVAMSVGGCSGEAPESEPAKPAPATTAPTSVESTTTEATTTEPTTTLEETTSTETARPPKPKTGAARWSSEVIEPYTSSPRDVYLLSRDVCQVFSPKQVAAEYKATSATARAAAFAYAQVTYQPPFRPAAEAGCLAGFHAG